VSCHASRRREPRAPRSPIQDPLGNGSGWPSAPSPKTCWPGAPASPCPHPPLPTSRNGCGCGSSPVAGRIVRTARRRVLHIDPTGPGPKRSPSRTPAWPRYPRPEPTFSTRRPGPGEPAERRAGDHPCPGYDDTDTKIIKLDRRSPYDRYERSRLTTTVRDCVGVSHTA
jgi:hypothetical protein